MFLILIIIILSLIITYFLYPIKNHGIKKYVIINDNLINLEGCAAPNSEHYYFCFNLKKYGWKIILLSELDISKLKKIKCIVLCLYESFDIGTLKCDNVSLVYFSADLYPYNPVRNTNINAADILISPYQYLFKTVQPMYKNILSKPSFCIPYSTVPEFFEKVEFNNNPKNKIFISGALRTDTVFRKYMVDLSENNDNIEVLKHPGYDSRKWKHKIVNASYYAKLNEYICCFTDTLTCHYLITKVYEIPSTGALLLIEDTLSDKLNELGFYDNINCIFCNKQNVLNKISWILDTKNRATVDLIRKKGMILVRKKHNTRVRSKQLDNIVNKYFKNLH